jgi:hypothetical protein
MDLTISTPEVTPEVEEIAAAVEASRKRIREVDPEAYAGFVTDAACYAVARRRDTKATDILRAWRALHPAPRRRFGPTIPPGANRVSEAGEAVA